MRDRDGERQRGRRTVGRSSGAGAAGSAGPRRAVAALGAGAAAVCTQAGDMLRNPTLHSLVHVLPHNAVVQTTPAFVVKGAGLPRDVPLSIAPAVLPWVNVSLLSENPRAAKRHIGVTAYRGLMIVPDQRTNAVRVEGRTNAVRVEAPLPSRGSRRRRRHGGHARARQAGAPTRRGDAGERGEGRVGGASQAQPRNRRLRLRPEGAPGREGQETGRCAGGCAA